MVKNKNHHMGSIIKAYAKEEIITQQLGYNFLALKKFIKTMSCIPSDYNVVKKILTSFNNLHIERDNIMYSLPNWHVHELRGNECVCLLDEGTSGDLIKALAAIARDHSVLGLYNLNIFTHIYHIFTIHSLIFTIYSHIFTICLLYIHTYLT